MGLRNKRGIATIEGIYFVVIIFILIVVLGIFAYAFNLITESIGQDIMVGAVNLSDATGSTLGQINTAILDKLNLIGLMLIFGMILGMIINAYFTRNDYPKLFFVIDIIILIIVYVVSVYVSNSYEIIITTHPFQTIFQSNLASASTFLLNLPIYSMVIGIIIMIVTYSNIPRSLKEETFIGRS